MRPVPAALTITLRRVFGQMELRKGAEGHGAEYTYAHELGHFKCSCTDEVEADKAAVQLLDDMQKHRLQAAVAERQR
jgi:hypothetical protein